MSEIMLMTETDYLQNRIEEQINWYSKKSSLCQSRYKNLRIIEIAAAAIIPLLSGMAQKVNFVPWVIGSLGVVIAISTAVGSLLKYHENWIQYRATSGALKHEKFLFLTRTAPYDGDDYFHVLVERVEGLISNENSTWTQTVKGEHKKVAKN